jgi:peptidyl-prolyl cis-trans isomerase A (cyclophilin A)
MKFFRNCRILVIALALSDGSGTIQTTSATQVDFQTSLGSFRANLFDATAPNTVANFLKYVDDGDYQNSLVHRSVPNFVIQGGGFKADFSPIPLDPPIANEFSLSNVRGTLAMAKPTNMPHGATSQWFINLVNNSPNLDLQNGGFTVFGEIVTTDMKIVDAIAALQRVNGGGAFTNFPILQPVAPDDTLLTVKSVVISNIVRVPEPAMFALVVGGMLATCGFRKAKRG